MPATYITELDDVALTLYNTLNTYIDYTTEWHRWPSTLPLTAQVWPQAETFCQTYIHITLSYYYKVVALTCQSLTHKLHNQVPPPVPSTQCSHTNYLRGYQPLVISHSMRMTLKTCKVKNMYSKQTKSSIHIHYNDIPK